jgi:adenylate kinase
MAAGKLVPDPIIIELLAERLTAPDCRNGYLLDGFPRTLGQAQALDDFFAESGVPLDVVLELRVDEDLLLKRLSGRGRDDDQPEVIRQRLKSYQTETKPLIDYYAAKGMLESIDGIGTPDEVFERITRVLEKKNAANFPPV